MRKNEEVVISIKGLKKKYRLGTIGGKTLSEDLKNYLLRVLKKTKKEEKKEFWALKGIDLEIKAGETVGIIGINGAGKSTLLKILSRVTAPTEGEVYIKGRLTSMLEVGTGFHGELTGRQNIYLNGAILGMSKSEINEKIEEIIEFSECGEFIDTPVKRYSSGMYVKLGFAVAAFLASEVIIMDEVLAVGDVNFQKKCLNKMKELAEQENRAVLYVSHNMSTIRQLCSRCIVLEKGELIFDGDVESAIKKYAIDEEEGFSDIIDLTKKRRSPNSLKTIQQQKLWILDTYDGYLNNSDCLKFKMQWQVKEDISNNVQVMFTFSDERDTRFASSVIDTQFENLKKGDVHTNLFEIDVSMFESGKYYCFITFFEVHPLGSREIVLDHTLRSFSFSILRPLTKKRNLIWLNRPYGSIRLNDCKVKSL